MIDETEVRNKTGVETTSGPVDNCREQLIRLTEHRGAQQSLPFITSVSVSISSW